ncbi:cytochrome b6/f complex subunit VIII [Iris pallida]|uniref:Cytochrome b6/f complex subunit VIII (Plastid) n=1 Tax=Iris pallida TaxID=29817 RepID=A0AAX6ES96_IRIPA|nr:cytochrome b6/f complex subunit VIII [Iris pallida]
MDITVRKTNPYFFSLFVSPFLNFYYLKRKSAAITAIHTFFPQEAISGCPKKRGPTPNKMRSFFR